MGAELCQYIGAKGDFIHWQLKCVNYNIVKDARHPLSFIAEIMKLLIKRDEEPVNISTSVIVERLSCGCVEVGRISCVAAQAFPHVQPVTNTAPQVHCDQHVDSIKQHV